MPYAWRRDFDDVVLAFLDFTPKVAAEDLPAAMRSHSQTKGMYRTLTLISFVNLTSPSPSSWPPITGSMVCQERRGGG